MDGRAVAIRGLGPPVGSSGWVRFPYEGRIRGFGPIGPVLGYVLPLGRIRGFVVARLWATNLAFFAVLGHFSCFSYQNLPL